MDKYDYVELYYLLLLFFYRNTNLRVFKNNQYTYITYMNNITELNLIVTKVNW